MNVYSPHICLVPKEVRTRMSGPLELESHTVVMDFENQILVFCKSNTCS